MASLLPLLVIFGPIVALVAVGVWLTRYRPAAWKTAAAAGVLGSIIWAIVVALYEHETPCGGASTCPTWYGFMPPASVPEGIGYLLLFGGMVAASALLGVRTTTPSITIGASLVAFPALLAWWTAPRGDNDGLWVLVFWVLGLVGAFAAACAETARAVASSVRHRA